MGELIMEKQYTQDVMPILVFVTILTAILLSGLLCKLFYKCKNKNKLRIVIIISFIIFNLVNFYIFRIAEYKVPILYQYIILPSVVIAFSAFIFMKPKPKK